MNRHFWFGQWLDDAQLDAAIERLDQHLERVLESPFPFEDLLTAAQAVSDGLRAGRPLHARLAALVRETTPDEEVDAMLAGASASLTRASLLTRVRAELGCSRPGIPTRRYPDRQFEAWSPVGCVVHVMPSNVFTLAALGLVEGLLPGNVNLVKLSARDSSFATEFAAALCEADPGGRLADYLAVVHVASSESRRLSALFERADAISAWGGERAMAAVREAAPPGARLITWGHKVSFAYVAAECLREPALLEAALDGVATDVCRLDQQACSSPQTLFVEADREGVERFATALAERLAVRSPEIPGQAPEGAEQAEITSVTAVARAEEALDLTRVIEDPAHGRWRILVDHRPGLRPSPLYRTLWVKGLEREAIIGTLRPMRAWLQSCGLACGLSSLATLSRRLFAAGVTRIARPGQMVDSYAGSPHDGVYALQQLARRITLDPPESARQVGSFSELEAHPPLPVAGLPIMDKTRFQAESQSVREVDLLFRSGGSSGRIVYSSFSWEDYHDQMTVAAHGLVAAGLEPDRDRVMNLFAAGHLYGSFISFWTILETLRVRTLPMGMIHDYEEIIETLLGTGCNTLIGAPSHLLALFMAADGRLTGRIEKVFYGGERLTDAQRRYLMETCGVSIVRSAAYGSNDAGPMGYQCPECEGGVHHLASAIQHLEIVDLDEDRPVAEGAVGRLLFSSLAREQPQVRRYEIGDTGRWIPGDCPCGRTDPRFELLGRTGDFFKAGGPFLNYRRFVDILGEHLGYDGPVQAHIHEDGNDTRLEIRLARRPGLEAAAAEACLRAQYAEIDFMEKEFGLAFRFEVSVVESDADFVFVPVSGKLKPICDHRSAAG